MAPSPRFKLKLERENTKPSEEVAAASTPRSTRRRGPASNRAVLESGLGAVRSRLYYDESFIRYLKLLVPPYAGGLVNSPMSSPPFARITR